MILCFFDIIKKQKVIKYILITFCFKYLINYTLISNTPERRLFCLSFFIKVLF